MSMIPALFVANWPEVIKGGQVNLMRLLERIDRRRFAPAVLVSREGSLSRRAHELGIDVEVLPIVRMELYRPHALIGNILPVLRLRRMIQARAVRLVYVDSPDHLAPVWLACRGTRAQVVWHVQTSAPTLLDRVFAGLADRIVSCSRAADARFAGSAVPRAVVPNSVDGERYSPASELEHSAARSGRRETVLLHQGELAGSKGLYDLLSIFAEARRESDQLVLWIAGRGNPVTERLLRLRARTLGLDDGVVRWLGYSANPLEMMRACDVFVFLSHSEGLSLALLEAMATGLPILASDIPSNREALGDAGVTVPLGDRRAAAAALIALVRDRSRRDALGRAARERALRCYPIQRFISELEALFETWAGA